MTTTIVETKQPITLNMKIGDVLKYHPELLDVIVAQSPHFSRLKNPILRRVHGHLVTVAQAATIAGIDPVKLVQTLNAAVGLDSPEAVPFALTSMADIPEPNWLQTAEIAGRLDVREDQRNHQDPFQRIINAAAKIPLGEVLYLRNTFEPLPLYDVLGRMGFIPWARKNQEEDWEIYFLRTGNRRPAPGTTEQNQSEDGRALDDLLPTASINIDVRDLTPPQPMLKILDALSSLLPGQTLVVHHRRRPVHLYPKLAELGYRQKTVEIGPDQVGVYIQKK